MICAPVLMIGFNRPDFSAGLIDCIRKAKPAKLYFAVDGPRNNHPEDIESVAKVQGLCQTIDWPCEIKTLFRKSNLGCARGVSEAITWFLGNEDHGIILEDDVRPTPRFFTFETELLEHYKNDVRIGIISGFNHYNFQTNQSVSYHFTNRTDIWGWGTWARVWRDYSLDVSQYLTTAESTIDAFTKNRRLRKMLKSAFNTVLNDKNVTWDYQFGIMSMIKGYLSVAPRKRLVGNVGAGDKRAVHHNVPLWYDATHFQDIWDGEEIIRHPQIVKPDIKAIRKTEYRLTGKAAGGLTYLGDKIPALRNVIYKTGNLLEAICPPLFRISW